MRKEILISVESEEARAALLEDGVLVEFYVDRPTNQRVAGNIYKGRVENVLPGMEAAFVNIGLERNAFLYVDDALVMKQDEDEDQVEDVKEFSIRNVLKEGQDVMVQVVKEAMGGKGARVTRHITLPGRFLVLMPMVGYVGVSRKITDDKERERLRKTAEWLRPQGMGLIVRTVAEGKSEAELTRDVEFLVRLWNRILTREQNSKSPALLHKDMGLVYRVVRDLFSEDVDRLFIDDLHEYERVLELLDAIAPSLKERVHYYSNKRQPIFEYFELDPEIEKAMKKRVWLRSGGYIVIDQMEALTAIDVNTGKYVGSSNLADTVFKTNIEAAKEIARQLRLRDIGGIIIIDFIDMDYAHHRHKVLSVLEEELRRDHTKTHVLGLTQLGLVELTRKKVRQGLDEYLMKACPYCEGRGRIPTEETMSRKVRREIKKILRHTTSEAMLVEVHPSVAALLIGPGGANLKELERETGKTIFVRGSEGCRFDDMNLKALGTREEVETKALPVKAGQIMELEVEEPHVTNNWDGIARVEGYVIDIEGAGSRVGERVKVEITKAFRTYAKAKIV